MLGGRDRSGPTWHYIKGPPIGPYDVLIAGQAQARSVILVTGNTDELKRVEGLTIENWGGD